MLYYKYLIYTTHSILEPLQKVGIKSCILQWSKLSFIEGNGTPLQYSCLENPMEGGAW